MEDTTPHVRSGVSLFSDVSFGELWLNAVSVALNIQFASVIVVKRRFTVAAADLFDPDSWKLFSW